LKWGSIILKVFLYPGQGSQKEGMEAGLASTEPGKIAFDKAQDVLGYDLLTLCRDGSKEQLQRTLYTQPALYVVSCILTDLLLEKGIRPEAVAGHSAGEYAALYAAGVFPFDIGLKVVGKRAKIMDDAGEKAGGAMAAIIRLAPKEVEKLVLALSPDGIIGVAGYNTDGQTVVSGEKKLVERAVREAKDRGARMAKMLPVSGAFHCDLMKEASNALAEVLEPEDFQSPQVTYVSNLSGQAMSDPSEIKRALAQLLVQPVRWTQCLETLASMQPEKYYEVGSGSVLAGMMKKFDPSADVAGVDGPDKITV
jgi:[acyl-carrier-protein] S-malonyltransferase